MVKFVNKTGDDSRDNAGVQKVKWGHVTWVCKGSQFVFPNKMISRYIYIYIYRVRQKSSP